METGTQSAEDGTNLAMLFNGVFDEAIVGLMR
jgi:hypothetical protein